jgi:hypothetical protein
MLIVHPNSLFEYLLELLACDASPCQACLSAVLKKKLLWLILLMMLPVLQLLVLKLVLRLALVLLVG